MIELNQFNKSFASLLVLILAFFFNANLTLAQLNSGKIVGITRDSNGAIVPGAVIEARNLGTNSTRRSVSSNSGAYEVLALPVGNYEITVGVPGFKRYVRKSIAVEVNQETRVDVELQVGEVSEIVLIEAEATQVQSANSTLGKVMTERQIVDLPLNGRNFYDLGLLQAGVTPLQPGRAGLTQNSYCVNGARDTFNNFLLDGVANQELEYNSLQIKPAIDALSEFKIQTSLYSAEFGRNAGATVNAVTRSGSNSFHGSVWDFLRNDAFDARNFFSQDVPALHRNQFGATLGGPVIVPGVFRGKDRTFFFVSYEGFRQRRGITESTVVPNEQERNGDFSFLAASVIDPLTGKPFPNNIIPQKRISSAARAILDLYPLPNIGGLPRTRNFTASPAQRFDEDQIITRIDHKVSPDDNVFGRYVYDDAEQADPFQGPNAPTFFPGYTSGQINKNQNFAFGYIHTFSPSTLNDFHFGFSRTNNPVTHLPLVKPRSVGIDFDVPENVGLTDIRISGFSGVGNNVLGPFHYVFNTFQFLDTFTTIRGKNTIKAGLEVRKHQENLRFQFTQNGQMLFTGLFTGDPLADFLLGRAFYFTYGSYERDRLYQRWWALDSFIQDDLKLTSKLTLNLGVRYEYVTPIINKAGLTATVLIRKPPDPDVPQSGVAESVLAGTNHLCDKCTYFPDKNNIEPRVGFAYDVFGNGKLAVRGGYGIFFNQIESNLALQNVLQAPFTTFPFIVDSGGAGFASLESPTCGGRCIPPGAGLVLVTDPHIQTPYMQHYNLSIQHEFAPDFLLELGYVGTLGRKLLQFRELNQPIFIPGTDANGKPLSTLANKEQRRPFANFSTIAQSTTWGSSNYNGLQVSVSKRFSRGYTFLAAYTFSKSIDFSSQYHSGAGSVIDPPLAQDDNNRDADRGLSSFDMRHRFTLSGSFEFSFGAGKRFFKRKGLVDKLAGGWVVSPILILSSGVPLTVRDFTDPCLAAGPFITTCRPNLVGDPNLPSSQRSPEQWINRKAFVRQPLGTFGNAGRNIVFADGAENLDLAMIKRTYLGGGERVRFIEFRAESFNLPNHPQFGVPDLDFSSPTFGRVLSTARGSTERQIQFALKLVY